MNTHLFASGHSTIESHPTAGSPEGDVPFDQSPWPFTTVSVRTAEDPAAVSTSIAAAVRSVDPDYPMTRVRTTDQVVSDSLVSDRFALVIFGSFAGLALLLAAIGIYGVMTFSVAQRNHEMGIRIALGAGNAHVLKQLVGEGMISALIGMAVGLPGVYVVGKLFVACFTTSAPSTFVPSLPSPSFFWPRLFSPAMPRRVAPPRSIP
jgi:ABC-type antimicrobial peptide transport system permease subunit